MYAYAYMYIYTNLLTDAGISYIISVCMNFVYYDIYIYRHVIYVHMYVNIYIFMSYWLGLCVLRTHKESRFCNSHVLIFT
jgi:hypothetical protein